MNCLERKPKKVRNVENSREIKTEYIVRESQVHTWNLGETKRKQNRTGTVFGELVTENFLKQMKITSVLNLILYTVIPNITLVSNYSSRCQGMLEK